MITDPNQPPVAPQPGTPAAAVPTPTVGQPAATPANVPVSAAPAAPAANPAATGNAATDTRHSLMGRIWDTIATGLTPNQWVQTDQGPKEVPGQKLKPGQVAGAILASALTGLAAGYSPSVRGKGAGAAFSAGFGATQELQQRTDELRRQKAQAQFENKQKADEMEMRRAQNAREQTKSIQDSQLFELQLKKYGMDIENSSWEQAQRVLASQEKALDREATIKAMHGTPAVMNGQEIPEFNDLQSAYEYLMQNGGGMSEALGAPNFLRQIVPTADGHFKIWDIPPTVHDLGYYSMKTNDKGQPVDKAGNVSYNPKDWQPDGTYRDEHNKPQVLPYQVSGDDYMKIRDQSDKIRRDNMSAEALADMRRSRASSFAKNDKLVSGALDNLKKVGGDYSKLSQGDRDTLIKSNKNKAALYRANMEADSSLLERANKDGDDERAAIYAAQLQEDEDNYSQATADYTTLMGTGPDGSTVVTTPSGPAKVTNGSAAGQLAMAAIKGSKNAKDAIAAINALPDAGPGVQGGVPPADKQLAIQIVQRSQTGTEAQTTSPDPAMLHTDQKIITNGKKFFVIAATANVPQGWSTTAVGQLPVGSAPAPEQPSPEPEENIK